MTQQHRARRIVDSAMVLAEQGGFEVVRLRDAATMMIEGRQEAT